MVLEIMVTRETCFQCLLWLPVCT